MYLQSAQYTHACQRIKHWVTDVQSFRTAIQGKQELTTIWCEFQGGGKHKKTNGTFGSKIKSVDNGESKQKKSRDCCKKKEPKRFYKLSVLVTLSYIEDMEPNLAWKTIVL